MARFNRPLYHFLLVFCNNNVSVLRRFRGISITFSTVYVTAHYLEKSFSVDVADERLSHVRFLIRV